MPSQLVGVYQALAEEYPKVMLMVRKVVWRCPQQLINLLGELALQIDAPVSASAYSPLVLFPSESARA